MAVGVPLMREVSTRQSNWIVDEAAIPMLVEKNNITETLALR